MSPITNFSIYGLFGERNVSLDLSQDVTVLIADNGLGKTTILGMIYAVLSGRLQRLRRVEFTTIRVTFADGKTIEIPQALVQPAYELRRDDPRIRRLMHELPESVMFELSEIAREGDYLNFRRNPLVREAMEATSAPPRYLFDAFRLSQHSSQLDLIGDEDTPEKIRQIITASFGVPVLYFPTYRRIEEELEQLGYERKERFRAEALIQFGMGDVLNRIQSITDLIKKSSVAWYSKINGQMLSQLVDGFQVDEPTRASIRNIEALKIVLDRIGDNISVGHKQHIIQLVEDGSISNGAHDYLVYFLSNLIKIYDQQKEQDNAIKAFAEVCNRYLVDKHVVYNESNVEIGVFSKRNDRPIELAKLSSGEKQIISLFSKLYLELREPLALLFDEPELSLSIEWQRMLLPDIMATGNCRFLLATTHSPFIFENQFDQFARDLRTFTTAV
jgi:predicted ATP-binding protein involved in virulence